MFKVFAYFLSNYAFRKIMTETIRLFDMPSQKLYVPPRKCSSNNNFDESYNPDYFYHLTDIHIKHYDNTTTETLRTALSLGLSYKSDFLLITGDVADNIAYKNLVLSMQVHDDWKCYKEVMDEFAPNYTKIVESLGNHDGARIWSLNSDDFYYKNYSQTSKYKNITKSISDFEIFVQKFGNFTHIILNPYQFPILPIPYAYEAFPTTRLLDRLEKEIEKADADKSLIISSHFHGYTWAHGKSSKGKTIFDIINNKKVSMFITGHNHGLDPAFVHYKNAIEVVGPDLGYASRAGFVTNDNGMIVYHGVDVHNPSKFFVTYPPSIEQTSTLTKCNIKNPVVRVISFNKSAELTVRIDENKEEKLSFTREIKDGVYLFTAPLKDLSNGIHAILVNGLNQSKDYDFIYGKDVETPEEYEYQYDDFLFLQYYIYFAYFFYVVALFITFPFDVLLFEKYNEWLYDRNNKENNFLNWCFSLSCGFIGIRGRIAMLGMPMRVALFISVLSAPFIPLRTFHIKDHALYTFAFGNLVNGEIRYEKSCSALLLNYLAITVFPVLQACSAIAMLLKDKAILVALLDLLIYYKLARDSYNDGVNGFFLLDGDGDCYNSVFVKFIQFWTVLMAFYVIYNFVIISLNVWKEDNNRNDSDELLKINSYDDENEEEERI